MTLSRFLDGAASVIVYALILSGTALAIAFTTLDIARLVKAHQAGAQARGVVAVCVWAVHRVFTRGASR